MNPAAPSSESSAPQADLRLAAGRAKATSLMPYLADALYAVTAVATTDVPTFAIDTRWRMYYNPRFVQSATVEETAGAWLHEVGHRLREHAERFTALAEPGERAPLFNQAADAAINADLRAAGVRLPAGKVWYPERIPGADPGATAEQMYRLLLAGPTGQRIDRRPALTLLPDTLPAGQGASTVVALAREPFLGTATTLALHDAAGKPVRTDAGRPATAALVVRDARGAEFTLDTDLPAGRYDVVLSRGTETATAPLTLTAPTIALRPDHLPHDRPGTVNVVVQGTDTAFTSDTRVHVVHPDGHALPVVTATTCLDATTLTVRLTDLPDGLHTVRVRTGEQVLTATLPAGRPHLDLTPACLPSGFLVPVALAATVTDLALDEPLTVDLGPLEGTAIPDALATPTRRGQDTLDLTLTRPLDEGRYTLTLTTGAGTALATLAVGGDDPGEGEGSGGDGERQESEESEESQGSDGGAGAGPEDAAEDEDDCGSGAGGPRRPWERDDSGTDAEGLDDGSVDAGRAELLRQQTARNVLEHARSRGTVPAGWQRWASGVLEPEVDWRQEMHSITRRVSANVAGLRDYSYSRPSRRAATFPDVVLPSLRQPRPPRVAEVVDTSGSISDEMLAQVHAETEAIVKRVRAEGVTIIACDAAASTPQRVRAMSEVRMVGGGGTDMRVGIAAAAAARPAFDLIVTLTDGDTPWPAAPPPTNPDARYVALLLDGDRDTVPTWMHKIVISSQGSADPRP